MGSLADCKDLGPAFAGESGLGAGGTPGAVGFYAAGVSEMSTMISAEISSSAVCT